MWSESVQLDLDQGNRVPRVHLVPSKWDKSYWVLLSATSTTITILVPKPDTLLLLGHKFHPQTAAQCTGITFSTLSQWASLPPINVQGTFFPSYMIHVIFTEICLFHDSSTISHKYHKPRYSGPCSPGISMEVHFGHLWQIWGVLGVGQDYARARLKSSGLSGIVSSKRSITGHTGTLESYWRTQSYKKFQSHSYYFGIYSVVLRGGDDTSNCLKVWAYDVDNHMINALSKVI